MKLYLNHIENIELEWKLFGMQQVANYTCQSYLMLPEARSNGKHNNNNINWENKNIIKQNEK